METVEQFEISKLRVLKNLGPLYFMENCLIFVLHNGREYDLALLVF